MPRTRTKPKDHTQNVDTVLGTETRGTETVAETLRPILAKSAPRYEEIGRRLRSLQDQFDASLARVSATTQR